MIASGSLPDVFNGGTKTGQLGRAGLLVNFKDVFGDAFFEQFFKGPLRQYTFDGKPYGLADMAQDFGDFANDRIMKKVGLNSPLTNSRFFSFASGPAATITIAASSPSTVAIRPKTPAALRF